MKEAHNGQWFIEQCRFIQDHQLYVGVPQDNEHLTMIAMVNEMGTNIAAKNGQFLCIPTKETMGIKPSQVDGLFRPKNSHVLAVKDDSQANGFRVMYILKESVRIPPRPFLRNCFALNKDKWVRNARDLGYLMTQREINDSEFLRRMGITITNDLKKTIEKFKDPKNAPLTEANKGFNDPLMQTGDLYRSIDYLITKKV